MKILIADDHALFRDGLALRLEQIAPEAAILQASNYAQIFKIIKSDNNISAIVLDIEMQDMPWFDALQEIRRTLPDTALIVVSASEDSRTIRSVMSAGAKGYIPKRSESKVFDNAFKLVFDGGT